MRERGISFATKHFLVTRLKNKESALGISITKKIDKRSARRNRLRRRLKELVRQKLGVKGYVVIVARRGSCEISFEEIERQIRKAFLNLEIC